MLHDIICRQENYTEVGVGRSTNQLHIYDEKGGGIKAVGMGRRTGL